MSSSNFEQRLADYLDGDLDAAGCAALLDEIEREAWAAETFRNALQLEALLRTVHQEALAAFPVERPEAANTEIGLSPEKIIPLKRVALRQFAPPWLALAAMVVLLLSVAVWVFRSSGQKPLGHQVVSGQILVNGTPGKLIPEGAKIEVVGDRSVAIHLADGSRVEFLPQSVARIQGQAGATREVITLIRGKGHFTVTKGKEMFRVETLLGSATALGTEFSVELQSHPIGPAETKEEMLVAVMAGRVQIKTPAKRVVVSDGESRIVRWGGEVLRPLADAEIEVVGRMTAELCMQNFSDEELSQKLEAKVTELQQTPTATANGKSLKQPDDRGDHGDRGMGTFVQEMLAQGLRGKALADAIHQEQARRGGGNGHGHNKGPGTKHGPGNGHENDHPRAVPRTGNLKMPGGAYDNLSAVQHIKL